MIADPKFLKQPREFWANVRTISQEVGYTDRKTGAIRVPRLTEIRVAFSKLNLTVDHIADRKDNLTAFGALLLDYYLFRAAVLNDVVRHNLLDKNAAQELFLDMRKTLKPTCPLPMNKQKGDKRNYSFLTCMVNMLIEANIGESPCDYDPRSLTTITHKGMPLRTLSRRVDGAFPATVNPIAIWEIKEYYYTTTFGSRVADGVYETLLDGLELTELEEAGHQRIHHTLIVDDRYTWWDCGRSYLCRMIDMLHIGLLDELLVGKEIVERLPDLAAQWSRSYRRRLEDATA